MIPVRARITWPITCLGGVRDISPNHPLADLVCPVCDESVDMRPVTMVLVGFRPEDRAEGKTWSTGGTVIVHADCAGVGTCNCPRGMKYHAMNCPSHPDELMNPEPAPSAETTPTATQPQES